MRLTMSGSRHDDPVSRPTVPLLANSDDAGTAPLANARLAERFASGSGNSAYLVDVPAVPLQRRAIAPTYNSAPASISPYIIAQPLPRRNTQGKREAFQPVQIKPASFFPATPARPGAAMALQIGGSAASVSSGKSIATSPRLMLYSYVFWRDGTANTLAPQGQYGGSQAGVIATYRLDDPVTAPVISVRFNIDAEQFARPEAALGLRLRPDEKLPVSLTIERRFRQGDADSVAAFLSGGIDPVTLPMNAHVAGYAQAGFDVRDDAADGARSIQHFYDANVRLEKHVARDGALSISAGGGMWAGGQRGVNRIDTGPGVNVGFSIADTSFRLSADYRMRIAGEVSPGSGLAVTLSASR